MKTRFMGKTGLRVSELCLGTMTFGSGADERESMAIMDRYAEEGGNFLDTADVYGRGRSEEIIGAWLKGKRRDDYVVATKVRGAMGDGPNDIGLSRKHIRSAITASLQRLGTDYIDLYQVHAWDPATPLEETLGALNELVREGLVRYLGASNFRGWQLMKALGISRERGWEPFVCLQPQYSLLCRATEYELLPLCASEGIGIIPWSPLRGGWLSGKFSRGMEKPPENTRVGDSPELWSKWNTETTWAIIDTVKEIAAESGKTSAQISINWLLSRAEITAPIIGARSVAQLEDNLGSSGWSLTTEQVERLNGISEMPVSYPYDYAAELQQRRGRERA